MNKLVLIMAIVGILGINEACKAKKAAQNSDSSASKSNNCTLRIDFYSIGAGTDYKAIESLVKYIETNKIAYETKPWGREGEVIYCLKFNDRSSKEAKVIKAEVKKMLANSQLVRIEEDAPIVKQ
jgi:hypothetical protein